MKKTIIGVLSLVIVLMVVGEVFAITGSIGNARMILRAEKGDKIEKYILVKNVNDVPLNIELSVSGDLEDYIDIKDKEFRLEPGKDKKAYFTIKVAKEGTTETKVNVRFAPEEGNGVGLSSTVIVIAEDNGGFFDWGNDEEETDEETENNEKVSVTTGRAIGIKKINPVAVGLLITTIVFIILIILLIIASAKITKSKKKSERECVGFLLLFL